MSYISLRTNYSYLLLTIVMLWGIPTLSLAQVTLSDNIQLSGFGTFAASKSDNQLPILSGRNITDEWCFDCDTTLGVQADWRISSKLRTTVQVVKRPEDTFSSPELERALIEYSTESFRAKVGRLRTPMFIMSEYYYVSSAYPWIRLPPEVYGNSLGLTYYEGVSVDMLHAFDNGNQIVFSPYIAIPREEQVNQYGAPFSLEISRALGFSSEFLYGDSLLHIAYVNLGATLTGLRTVPKSYDLDVFSLGISHYFGQLHFQAETMLSQNFSSDWYISVDYQLENLTPYIQYGQARLTHDTESYLVGFRYDWTPQLNTSIEWQRFYGRENVISGHFTVPQDPTKPFSTKVDLLSIGLSLTF
ncbi:hypothetical protein [Vibrio bivalvicida]|uniref:Sulfate ABC transporter permease n=1 Tax=Vibrio bivalvicida TaxID=1276888 RepID=A0A177Y2F3_9VIBR|nr:hypothetical protein [Vibrio bivalvicida]OAJ95053.1 sulfate ABC transporter permease [Vibrio bivalvicida]